MPSPLDETARRLLDLLRSAAIDLVFEIKHPLVASHPMALDRILFLISRPEWMSEVEKANPRAALEIPLRILLLGCKTRTEILYRTARECLNPYPGPDLHEIARRIDESIVGVIDRLEDPDVMTDFSPFEKRFVLYGDLLGTSNSSSYERQRSIVKMLQDIRSWTSEESRSIDKVNNAGSIGYGPLAQIRVTPEFSAVSDHFVASYKLTDFEYGERPWLHLCLLDAQTIMGKIAFNALELGLLVRGGITTGDLFHKSGVIFGQGMINAYKLESEVAIYPRVAVGPEFYELESYDRDVQSLLCKDKDGILHLKYFRQMSMHALERNKGDSTEESIKWYKVTHRMLSENIESLKNEGKLKEMAKWVWFKDKFETEIGSDRRFCGYPGLE